MLLINALAIDMEWVVQFDFEKTHGEPFYKDDGEEILATALCIDDLFSKNIKYYLDNDITVLTMDLKEYDGTQLEFMAIMPKENLSGYVKMYLKNK